MWNHGKSAKLLQRATIDSLSSSSIFSARFVLVLRSFLLLPCVLPRVVSCMLEELLHREPDSCQHVVWESSLSDLYRAYQFVLAKEEHGAVCVRTAHPHVCVSVNRALSDPRCLTRVLGIRVENHGCAVAGAHCAVEVPVDSRRKVGRHFLVLVVCDELLSRAAVPCQPVDAC